MLAEQFAAFLFDLDGVVYVGEEALPGARESLARLRETGKPVRFLTNDPRPTRADVARRLSGLGAEADPEEVVTSGWATAEHLREIGAHSAYVVGSAGLAAEIKEAGVRVVRQLGGGCDAVVVGCDERVSYEHIRRASELVHGGAAFVATNDDGSFPGPEGPLPATGAIVAAVRAATGERPTVVGKPHDRMFDLCARNLGVEPSRAAVIGDNPETDILGAHRKGFVGILVSPRPVVFPSPRDYRAPDATIADLRGLFDPETTARRWKRPAFPWPEGVKAGVAGVAFDRRGRVLLARRADNGLWGLPSGHVEPGETVEEAVVREVREETGLRVEVERLIGIYSHPESQTFSYPSGEVSQFVTSCLMCEVSGGELRADGVETLDAAFFPTDALPDGLLPMHPRWLSDALAGSVHAFVR